MPPKKSGGAGNKKKAKPISNRGFATVSIPKKKEPELEETSEGSAPENGAVQTNAVASTSQLNGVGTATETATVPDGAAAATEEAEWDAEEMEKLEWSRLADKIRSTVDKEVARVLKVSFSVAENLASFRCRTASTQALPLVQVIDYERRLSRSLPTYFWTDQDLQRRIIELGQSLSAEEAPQPLYEPEDKVITKIATLWGVLEGIGFRTERIEECLTQAKSLDLEDALDWLFLHCDAEELGCEGPIAPTIPPAEPSLDSTIPKTDSLESSTPRPTRSSSPTPSTSVVGSVTPNQDDEARANASIRARILAYETNDDDDDAQDGDQKSEPDLDDMKDDQDANTRYARLKLQLSEIQRAQGVSKRLAIKRRTGPTREDEWREHKVTELIKKIGEIEEDYTFRRVDADLIYREERTKLDAAVLADRLNGTSLATPPQTSSGIVEEATSEGPETSTPSVEAAVAGPTLSADPPSVEEGDEGGMFGNLLDEMPTEETSEETGQTIYVRDMGLPKHFSGKTPKTNLEETVRKIDKYATVVFRVISRGTRACRASVTIAWGDGSGRKQLWRMDDVACHDHKQAFDYIATVALFEVNSTNVHKQLPAIFRDLWDELAEKKKGEDEARYRERLKVWKRLAEPRMAEPPSRVRFRSFDEVWRARRLTSYCDALQDPRITRMPSSAAPEAKILPASFTPPEVSEKIKADFAQRQDWPAYQEMLVSTDRWVQMMTSFSVEALRPSQDRFTSQQQRAKLPIANYRSFIMSTIEQNQCVVLCGETGCGKSTQVPSFIVEHDMRKGRNVKVYCTEPRRISAISLAQRVSSELGEASGACGSRSSLVGYSIRLDSAISASSRIVYATTGIVLRMLESREALSDLTHIIIDEVHERSIDSDFLLIVLREILEVRKDLKVILMSATVDAEKIASYMGDCPVITVPGRTFPVTPHFLEDVIELTQYRLTPTTDSQYVARSKRSYNGSGRPRKSADDEAPPDEDEEPDLPAGGLIKTLTTLSKQSRTTLECMDQHVINYGLITLLLEQLCFERRELIPFSNAILIFLPGIESIRRLTDMLEGHPKFGTNSFLILPLHSTISNDNQGLVFNVPRRGIRKIVISTCVLCEFSDVLTMVIGGTHRVALAIHRNIAETGVTIPDITAVIDTGKHREMRFDEKRQISRLVETFVAQSNAAQRRGRAGRVQEGICFHLFSKQRHDTIVSTGGRVMAEHPQPEMLRLSLQDLALRIKIMKIGNASIEDVLLRALDPPLLVNIQRAVFSLIEAKALTSTEEITPLGRHLAKLPMDVHLGKFLIMATIFNCLDAALTIAAALNAKSPWMTPFGREAEADAVKRGFKVENSDFLTLYNAYCSWREASGNGYEREFTRKNFLSQQNLQEIEQGRQQYFSFLVDAGFIDISEAEKRDLVSTRYGKSRTRFVRVPNELDTHSRDPKAVMACLAASMYPKLLVIDPQSGQMKTLAKNTPAAIHPSSVNFAPGRRVDFGGSKFVAFFTAMHTHKLYVWESGTVDERAVYLLCGNADTQLAAHSLSIDRKIRIRLEPKTSIAMRLLRQQWNSFFLAKMKNPTMTTSEPHAAWLDLVKEALCSPRKDEDSVTAEMRKKKVVEQMKLSVIKNA
ncbi:BZ3500_MvSof-1268-A1-R1_Chr7-1g09268 [Microbotryum saponariae]|uniref:RNA helicase n=1 Tax=Microbotryum saponariae TaxID=289078 RepID=A0A2X0LDH2_9BASI|nr:BZ3501_MvSof-1269-A2-R1_Chr7-1g08973 [Microbotryum saponariae]SDA03120.1 BZ3500_MvSof-1268-A1-R1_Chr7-1g09268 [Microbotryum saponariae]